MVFSFTNKKLMRKHLQLPRNPTEVEMRDVYTKLLKDNGLSNPGLFEALSLDKPEIRNVVEAALQHG